MNLPNKLTMARIIAVPVFCVLYVLGYRWPAFIVFILASVTDFLDGRIARKRNLVTNFGKIMDPLADKILVYSAFTLMVANGTVAAWMLIVILFREFIVAGMRTVAASEGIVIAAGKTGKIKTTLQMIAVPMLILDIPGWWHKAAVILLWASVIMTVVSGAEYIYENRKVFSM